MFDFNGRTLTDERAQNFLDQGIWANESFVDVLKRNVDQFPDLIHKDETRSITYQEMWNEVEAVAASFYDMGIRKGDRVALQLPNTLDNVIAIFGLSRIGAVSVELQVDLGRDAIIYSLKQVQAKAWIIADNFRGQPLYEMAMEIKETIPSLESVILQGTSEAYEEALTFTSLRDSEKKLSEKELNENKPGPLDGFLMVSTSGTTGSPKGVVHYHANYLWATRILAKNFGYESGDAVLDVAPICHQTGMLAGVMMTIVSGGRILLLDRFSANRVLKWVKEEKPAFIIGAPPHVIHVANAPKLPETDTSSVKVFIYAGAPVPSTILQRLQTEGGIKVGAMFGWSEGFVATATRPDDPLDAISSTVGFGLPGLDIRLIDEDGNEVKQGESGEMLCRGPNFSPGYFENPEAAHRQWDEDGWFHSGDVLKQDENGRFQFIARADDIINRGGTKVDPKSIEDLIGGFEGVEEVSVVGAPHETLGQQTVACVVLKEDAEPFALKDLRTYLADNGLAKFQLPDRLEFLESLPMTHSGKYRKIELRERFIEEAKLKA